MPAMAAASAKISTLVRVRSRPTVVHAAGLSFMAWSRRPNSPRRNATTKHASTANTAAIATKYALSLAIGLQRSNVLLSVAKPAICPSTFCSTTNANAIVPSAR